MSSPRNVRVPADTRHAARIAAAPLIVGVLVCLASLAAFAGLWDTVKDQDRLTTAFDHAVLTWMHHHQIPWLTTLARGLAFLGSPPVVVAIAAFGTLAGFVWRRVRGAAWTLPLAVLGAGILIQAIKIAFRRPRPTLFAPLLHENGYSFPSGHSLIAIVVYGLLGYFLMALFQRRAARLTIGALTAALIVLIGLSRPYVQVHYPTDVLAGWTVGLPWLVTCLALHERLAKRWASAGKPVFKQESGRGDG